MVNPAVLLLFKVEDLGLSAHLGAVFKYGLQLDILVGHRQNGASNGQDLAHLSHRLVEGGRNSVQGRQKQIAEGLPRQSSLGITVGKQSTHERLLVGQGLHAVADIPRRGHTQLLPQGARAAAVIRHRDNGSEVIGAVLQSTQHGRQSVSAANGHNGRSVFLSHISSPRHVPVVLRDLIAQTTHVLCQRMGHGH